MSKFAPLLEPITLSNGITLANRFVLSPMTTNSSTKAQAMKQEGNKAIIQLAHAGRFSNTAIMNYGEVYGPSPMTLHSPIKHDVLEYIKFTFRFYGIFLK
ncbi:hypothetical protein VQ623_00970 [Staphylococcus haemolyticus]|nr:hypothetical protein [Staphylococcus haemolyticus]WRV64868.1 hypothetical protein VQ623_00970 [Staphylococcus haemolyticus]